MTFIGKHLPLEYDRVLSRRIKTKTDMIWCTRQHISGAAGVFPGQPVRYGHHALSIQFYKDVLPRLRRATVAKKDYVI